MDATIPLMPDLDGFRAKVLTVKPRGPLVCCVCHRRPIHYGNLAVCRHPGCLIEATRLGWWR